MAQESFIHDNSHQTRKTPEFPCSWYSPETGIYSSKHRNVELPTNPFVDVVSHIFSYPNNGGSAFIDASSGYSISYSDLLPLVQATAFGLHEMGVSQGDVVLILLPNSILYPVLFLGALYLGAIVTPMNPLSSFSEVKNQTVGVHVSMAFALAQTAIKLRALGLKVVEVPENVNLGDENGKFSDLYKLVLGNAGNSIPRPRINQDDTAAIMYSSGTTGASKGVVLTHRNFIATVELFVRFEASQYKEMSWENVYLAVLPMFHIYGLAIFGVGLLSLGTSVVVMKKFNVEEVFKAIERYKITHIPVVPPIMAAMALKAKSQFHGGSSLSSLKQVSCGAAPLTTKVIADFCRCFPHVDFIQGYGMTETTAVGTRGFNPGNVKNYTSVGLLAPTVEAKVVNWNTGLCLPPGKAGELLLRGPGVMKGYLNNSEATRLAIEEDGWLHTGDVAYFDHDGYLYILDRLKEIIKYKGFQIAPADLEAVLMSHPNILDAAVTAAADEEAGEIPVAFVVKRPGSSLSRDEVIEHVAKEVAPCKKVREVVFVTSIPKSPAGKVLRRQLKRLRTSKL
ncbi:hypothetical protein Cgig2_022080 [Carnegiea gigantea]|uniref:4-coumarate--CoA ligase n=1 Tax=Carnegiea gigantea TaxID=171969 RepID=A0A9Q1QN74_9CARY|nr:hypothetical protein Cgig2_022080 [Carnegiea gigantea]